MAGSFYRAAMGMRLLFVAPKVLTCTMAVCISTRGNARQPEATDTYCFFIEINDFSKFTSCPIFKYLKFDLLSVSLER